MKIKIWTGGFCQTNGYVWEHEGKLWVVDAPEGMAKFLTMEKMPVGGLILTHGHFDHIEDAAKIQRDFDCPVWIHKLDRRLCEETEEVMRYVREAFGVELSLESFKPNYELVVPGFLDFGGHRFDLLHCPGHSPGSVCFWEKNAGILLGGDVLFAGGVGRWDLPGGDRKVLLESIRTRLFTLPENTQVLPGHGPMTTIGREMRTNPFIRLPVE